MCQIPGMFLSRVTVNWEAWEMYYSDMFIGAVNLMVNIVSIQDILDILARFKWGWLTVVENMSLFYYQYLVSHKCKLFKRECRMYIEMFLWEYTFNNLVQYTFVQQRPFPVCKISGRRWRQPDNFVNPCPPEPFSVTRLPKRVRVVAIPLPGFSIFKALYPYIYYQCIAMGLFFPLIPKRYHPSSYDITMAS